MRGELQTEAEDMLPVPVCYTLVPSPEHDLEGHPENVARFELLETCYGRSAQAASPNAFDSAEISEEAILRVHPEAYLRSLEAACRRVRPTWIWRRPTSLRARWGRRVGRLEGHSPFVDSVLAGEARTGFALDSTTWPSRHGSTRAMGFCLLNNLAIAARHAQEAGPATGDDRRFRRASRERDAGYLRSRTPMCWISQRTSPGSTLGAVR